MADRTPAKPRKSTRRALIRVWHNSDTKLSLRTWARDCAASEHDSDDSRLTKKQAQDWFANKRANFSTPPLGIGRTRTRVKSGGNKGQQPKKLDGR